MHFIITAEQSRGRLDKFLKQHFPDFSRAHLQKLIRSGGVTVNGARISAHHFLRLGEQVEATVDLPPQLLVTANTQVELKVLRGEPDFVILNKPAGRVMHQSVAHPAPDTLVNGLLARYPEIARVGEDLLRPGIVHRLDKEVSGVLVVARTQDMYDHLKAQFKQHMIVKEYRALVAGKVSPPSGVIEFALVRKGTRMVARPKGAEGKKAVTEYEVIKQISPIGPIILLRICTRTGRTHQIRVHLQALGHPILGDRLYNKSAESSGLMLHARGIGFVDLQGQKREFIVEADWE